MRAMAMAAVLAASVLAPSEAGASAMPSPEGLWMPVGVTLGAAFGEADPVLGGSPGFFLGGELSIVQLGLGSELLWLGGVADAAYDFGSEDVRHRLGVEFGWTFVGMDVAYMGTIRNDTYYPGINFRIYGTISLVTLYGGYSRIFSNIPRNDIYEVGGLVKFPIPLDINNDKPRRPDR